MMLSDSHRLLFVEVPHTGTHSISKLLYERFGARQILRKHANLSQFLHQATPDQRRYFKFATVRNPLDTAVTHYFKLRDNHKGQYTNPKRFMENGGYLTPEHLQQFRFVHDEGADFEAFFRRFRNAIYNNWFLLGHGRYDFVIRFEELQAGYEEAMQRAGVADPGAVPHTNPTRGRSDRKHFLEYYTPAIRAQALRCYGPFMLRWGYVVPKDWEDRRVPLESRVKFEIQDRAVNLASQFMTLDPDSKLVTRTRAMIDSVLR